MVGVQPILGCDMLVNMGLEDSPFCRLEEENKGIRTV